MSRNNRSRGRRGPSRRGKSRDGRAGSESAPKKRIIPTRPRIPNVIPEAFEGGMVIFDNDQYYPVYVEILLMSLKEMPVVKVETRGEFEGFKTAFATEKYQQNIYIIDELFGWGEVDIPRLIANIRQLDPKAVVVGCTAVANGEILHEKVYDHVCVKSKGNHEQSMTKILAKILGVDLVIDNSDPEYSNMHI